MLQTVSRGLHEVTFQVFLVFFLGLKKPCEIQTEGINIKKIESTLSCMYEYTAPGFDRLTNSEDFALIFNHIYQYHQDDIFGAEKKTLGKYRAKYQARIDEIQHLLY